jgi:PLP dependent protein
MGEYTSRYGDALERIARATGRCGRSPSTVSLVAVSKQAPVSAIQELYESGCRNFGESRLDTAFDKVAAMPSDIRWHFIGTLQRKKVAKIGREFALIHSVDSLELALKLSSHSAAVGVITDILLQVNTSGELTKHGLSPEQWRVHIDQILEHPGVRIKGLMTMAPFVDDEVIVRRCFAALRSCRDDLQRAAGTAATLEHLSMGMSHDFEWAIQEGATMLRLGTLLFGMV